VYPATTAPRSVRRSPRMGTQASSTRVEKARRKSWAAAGGDAHGRMDKDRARALLDQERRRLDELSRAVSRGHDDARQPSLSRLRSAAAGL
jgi:hypothetical protein